MLNAMENDIKEILEKPVTLDDEQMQRLTEKQRVPTSFKD